MLIVYCAGTEYMANSQNETTDVGPLFGELVWMFKSAVQQLS